MKGRKSLSGSNKKKWEGEILDTRRERDKRFNREWRWKVSTKWRNGDVRWRRKSRNREVRITDDTLGKVVTRNKVTGRNTLYTFPSLFLTFPLLLSLSLSYSLSLFLCSIPQIGCSAFLVSERKRWERKRMWGKKLNHFHLFFHESSNYPVRYIYFLCPFSLLSISIFPSRIEEMRRRNKREERINKKRGKKRETTSWTLAGT